MSAEQKTLPDYSYSWDLSDLSGILSADIRDYDNDGQEEMLVLRFDPEAYEEEPYTGIREIAMVLEMYEVRDDSAVCAAERWLTAYSYGSMGRAGSFTSLFLYPAEGKTRIAVDTFFMVEEYTSTLTTYEYDGTGLVFLSANAFVQTGEGDLLIRSAAADPGEFCAITGSEYRAIAAGDTAWMTVDKYDVEEHDWATVSPEEEDHYRNAYEGLLSVQGLLVHDDRTSVTRYSENMTAQDYDDIYHRRQTTPIDEVYTPAEGELTVLGRLCSYQVLGGPLTLERIDLTGLHEGR